MADLSSSKRIIAHWKPVAAVMSVLILLNLALHVFVIREDVRVSGDREAILATEREGLGELETEVASLEKTVSKIACTRSDERNVFEHLISGKSTRMIAVLRELHQLAEELRVEPGRLSYTRSKGEKSGLVRFGASLAFEAEYEVLHQYIERIENSPNFLFIQQIDLAGSRQAGQKDLRLNLRLATWFQSPDLERLDATLASAGAGS